LGEADADGRRAGAAATRTIGSDRAGQPHVRSADARLHLLAEDGFLTLEADERVLRAHRARVHAREVRAAVEAVDHLLELDRVAGIRIDHAGRVAELAEVHLASATAVRLERVVAAVALLRGDVLPDGGHGPAGGNEVAGRVGDEIRALVR